jgi:hypothetical protein
MALRLLLLLLERRRRRRKMEMEMIMNREGELVALWVILLNVSKTHPSTLLEMKLPLAMMKILMVQ